MSKERVELLKNAVRFFYDLQKLRQQASARASKKADAAQVQLEEEDKAFLDKMGGSLKDLEKDGLREVKRLLKGVPIWETFLKGVKGVGPTMAGVIISEFNIENCNTVSQMWAFAGLAVRDGKADRRVKGQKARFNPWLKSKMIKVLGDCLIKSNSPYRKFYDDYKHRKENQLVDVCMACEGKGQVTYKKKKDGTEEEVPANGDQKDGKTVTCKNCKGTGGPAPWGKSQAHRHAAAVRYMVKMLLQSLWVEWRTLEGLDVRAPYAEEYLGRVHHS
jgi:hypothetical protein